MDILYYSNHCKHSQKVLQFLVKGNMADKLNFICIDKRVRDAQNNQMYIVLENGKRVTMPPNLHSVPALLQVKQNYSIILGDDIIKYVTSNPKTVFEDSLFSDVKKLMSQNRIWDLPVVDYQNKLLGLVHMSSLLK